MIDKLLDTPYWTELPEVVTDMLQGRRIYMKRVGNGSKDIVKLYHLLFTMCEQEFYQYKGSLYRNPLDIYKAQNGTIHPKFRFWNNQQVTRHLEKDLTQVHAVIQDALYNLINSHVNTDKSQVTASFLRYIREEKNVHALFIIWRKSLRLLREGWQGNVPQLLKEIEKNSLSPRVIHRF